MAYQRERTRIAATTIARARRMIAQGTVPGRGLDIADEVTPGLVLRVGPQGARWMLKTRTRTVTLAPLDDMTIAAARLAAVGARADVDAGCEPAENVRIYAGARALGARPEDAADAAWPIGYVEDDKELRRRERPWAVEDLIDEFVTWKIARPRPGYGAKWERYLRLDAFKPLARREVRSLTIDDLERLRDALVESHPNPEGWRLEFLSQGPRDRVGRRRDCGSRRAGCDS